MTSRSAVECSATELYPLHFNVCMIRLCIDKYKYKNVFSKTKVIRGQPELNR